MTTHASELVPDPVAHISISGVHGGDELDKRLANAPVYDPARHSGRLSALLAGVALGAAAMFILRR